MRTVNFHPSLSTTAAITKKMTSSFASLITNFLVVTLLLPNINKIMAVPSVTDAKQKQNNPTSRAVHTVDERTSQLLSRRRALCTPTSCSTNCTPDYTHQSAFRLEITTDHNPTEMSWILSDAKNNRVIHFVKEGDDKYNRPSSFYQQSFFLESKGFCYHFQMIIIKDDAICCAWDNGVYHVFYDDKLIMEGNNFGKGEASLLFGDACTSSISQTSDPSSSSSETGVLSGPPPLTSPRKTLSPAANKDLPFMSIQPDFLSFVSSPSSRPSITSVLSSSALSSSSKLPSSSLPLEPSDKPTSSTPLVEILSRSLWTQQTEESISMPLPLASSATSSSTTEVCSDPTQALFQFELMTDAYPTEISWTLTNVNSNAVTIFVDTGTYSNAISFYEESYCIEATQCYQFTISDSYGDGICCLEGNGYYKISFQKELLLEGGDFGGSQSSALFGNGCPTESPVPSSTPSLTVEPTVLHSSVPSSTPSLSVQPSSNPTLSLKPSDEPSWSPTTSSIPTSFPDQNTNLIVKDEYNRRYFPKMPIRPEGSFQYQPVPDCSSSIGRIGCVAIPSSFEVDPPHWAGMLHTIPPSCNNRKRKCTVGIPIPRTTHELGKDLIPVLKKRVFDDPVNLPGGALWTFSVAIGDMNNDGLLDIVIGNTNDKNQLFINAGDGAFGDAVDLPGGALDTWSVAIGDMNNDGLLDIVIGNDNDKNQLLINAGDGTFLGDAVDLPGGALSTRSVTIGDMNNDGLLDIVIGNDNQNNQLLLNAGDGTFGDAVDLPGDDLPTLSVAIGDMNNDGLLDIVIGNNGQNNQLIINSGDGTFLDDAVDLPGDALYTRSVGIGDMNNDGLLDIVIGNYDENNNQLLLNAGDGTFDDAVDLPGGALTTLSVAIGDMNNDGLLDIVISNYDVNNNQLLLNAGDGAFDDAMDLPGDYTYSVGIADMNNKIK